MRKSISLGFGIFIGIFPVWGFQLLIAIATSIYFKLNKVLVILAANISIPPLIPVILFASHEVGKIWMGENAQDLVYSTSISFDTIQKSLFQYIVGACTLSVVAGTLTTLIAYLLLSLRKR
jgi:uncharacterized protein (DUF2062 family)